MGKVTRKSKIQSEQLTRPSQCLFYTKAPNPLYSVNEEPVPFLGLILFDPWSIIFVVFSLDLSNHCEFCGRWPAPCHQASSPINISFIAGLTDKREEPGLDKLITAFHPVLSSDLESFRLSSRLVFAESFRIQERWTIQSGAIEEVD